MRATSWAKPNRSEQSDYSRRTPWDPVFRMCETLTPVRENLLSRRLLISFMGFGKDGKGVIINEDRSQALSTLANQAVILIGTKLGILKDFRMLKAELRAHLRNLTPGDGMGLIIGLADGDLTNSEIAAAILANAPLGPNDIVGTQVAERFNMLLSVAEGDLAETQVLFKNENGGPIIVVKPRWTFATTKSWNWFIFNGGGTALATGATVRITTKCYGVWLR